MKVYLPIEYPKWFGDVLVQNADEEQAHRKTVANVAEVTRATELAPPPSSASIRMHRTRERRREGKLSIRCDVSMEHIEALAEAGLIDPAMRDDATEVALGVIRAIDRLTQSQQEAALPGG